MAAATATKPATEPDKPEEKAPDPAATKPATEAGQPTRGLRRMRKDGQTPIPAHELRYSRLETFRKALEKAGEKGISIPAGSLRIVGVDEGQGGIWFRGHRGPTGAEVAIHFNEIDRALGGQPYRAA